MSQAKELNDATILTVEERKELQLSSVAKKEPSTRQLIINEYKEKLIAAPDGGGVFIPSEYAQRVNVRRRASKAANQLGYRIQFTPNYRGGELITVYKDETA